MKCLKCGNTLPEDSDFCQYCGTKIERSAHRDEQEKEAYSPYDKPDKKSTKTTMWLVAALIAAFVVIAILCTVIFTRGDNKDKPKEGSTTEAIETNTNEHQASPAVNDVPVDPTEKKSEDLLASAADSVLYLEIYDEQDECIGTATGFLVDNDTTLVTNYHVVQDAYSIGAWTQDDQFVKADTLLAYNEVSDLALLRCDSSVAKEPLVLANSDEVKQTISVYAIGYPLGLANTVSNGIISARYIDEYGNDTLQTTAAVSSGNSGGPLLNENGEVIGVICACYVDGQNLNLAIASNTLKEMLEQRFKPIDLADWDDRPSMPTDCQHEFGEWIIDQAPTCTEGGQESCVCNLCGEVQINELPPAGHTKTVDPARKATCSESGLTEGSHCSVCGETLVEQSSTSKVGHTFTDGTCSVCGTQDPNYVPTISKEELIGTWRRWFKYNDAYGQETYVFNADGSYTSEYLPPTGYYDELAPYNSYGTYELNGTTLTFYETSYAEYGIIYRSNGTTTVGTVLDITEESLYLDRGYVFMRVDG